MNIETDGLVIKTQKIGESDTLITVLTSKYGLIRAFVRRSTAVKSNMLATTQLLSYNDFVFYKGKNSYSVTSATPKASFFKLNEDIDAMAIGFYLAELFGELAPENHESEDLLKLLLNSLYLMAEKKRPPVQVKAVAELRALSNSGYMPNLVACENCGTYESDPMFFNPASGLLFCSNCGGPADGMQRPGGRHATVPVGSDRHALHLLQRREEGLQLLALRRSAFRTLPGGGTVHIAADRKKLQDVRFL